MTQMRKCRVGLRLTLMFMACLSLVACGATNTGSVRPATLSQSSQTTGTDSPEASSGNSVSDEQSNDVTLPQRIAVMPFKADADANPEIIEMLRESVFSHLSSTNYSFVRPQIVDQRTLLIKQDNGFTIDDVPMLAQMLDSDAILIGTVIDSEVLYAGVAASIFYKVEVSLVNKQGDIIWKDIFSERSIEGGVSADPFTMLYTLAVTAMHVGKENLFAVADKIGRQVAASIPQPEGLFDNQTIFIDSVIHDAVNKVLSYGDSIRVGVKAPPRMNVNVSIESLNQMFPLKEGQEGTYFTDIPVNPNWNGKDLMLTAFAVDKSGNRARKISTVGLINFDNIAPEAVTNLDIQLSSQQLSARWEHPETNLYYVLYKKVGDNKVELTRTKNKRLEFEQEHQAFQIYEYVIVAEDEVGNVSSNDFIELQYFPSNAIKQASQITQASLPDSLSKDSVMLKKYGPYLIDKNTKVEQGVNLFIEPGVKLEFTQSGTLEVEGSLHTFGGEAIELNTINGRPADQAFLRLNSDAHVELNGFSITNAGIGIEVKKGRPFIQNGKILNSKFSALSISDFANVNVESVSIKGSNTSAVVVADSARLSIKKSAFENNLPFHIQNSSTYSVFATGNTWLPAADALTILGNVNY